MDNIGFLTALGGGILAFLSPCVLPLVPVYIAGLAGSSVEESSRHSPFSSLPLALAFVLGFSAIFVPLGALAAYLGSLTINYVDVIRKVGGVILVILGIHMMGLIKVPFLYRQAGIEVRTGRKRGVVRSTLMGLAFALGWTPCVGAVLGGILGLAYSSDTVWDGVKLLIVFSLGLGIPFVAVSLAIGPASRFFKVINRHARMISVASGVLLVALGILMMTGQLVRLTAALSAP